MKTTFDHLRAFPLSWLSLAFLAGIVLARQVTLSVLFWFGLSGLFLVLGILAYVFAGRLAFLKISPSTLFLLSVSLVFFFLGGSRYQASQPKIDAFHIAWYNDREYDVLVTGALAEPPDYRDTYTNLRIETEAIDTGSGDLPVDGLLLARVYANEIYEYGERVRIRGQLLTPPENEDFSYRDYLAGQGIHAYMSKTEVTHLPGNAGNPVKRMLYAFKDKALANIYLIFPDPEASLLAGILLGVDTGLPKDLQQAFKDTGTAHIIAISGFNIAIIAGLFFTMFSRVFGQARGSFFAILGIAVYTFLVGADAAVVRAALMGSLSLFARQFGRRNDGLNALLVSAAVMTLANPHTPWDVGFQLSFFATLGLILYAEPFQGWAVNIIARYTNPGAAQKIASPLSEYILLTLAAQLTTLPIMAWHFKRISLVSLVANPFILPVQPAVMILGGIAVLLSLVWLPLGGIAAFGAWPFVAYTIRLVETFDRLPHGVIVLGDFSLWLVVLFYLALLTWTFGRSRLKEFLSSRKANLPPLPAVTVTAALTVLVILTWRAAFAAPDGRLHLTFLDVGSADAVLIQTPGGRHILVNGGPSASMLSDGLGRRLPPLDRRLDWLVIASTQENQLSGLPRVVERIRPGNVLWAGNPEASYAARTLDGWLTGQGIPVTRAETGAELDLGQGAVLRVLNANARGAVLLIEWNTFRALLPVGMNFEALEELEYGKAIGKTSLLLLSDSGYAPISPPEWIANLNPQVILLSVAAGDKDGLPDQELLDSIEDYPLLRTDRNGWIEATTDGQQMWIRVEEQAQRPTPTAPSEQIPSSGLGIHKIHREQLFGRNEEN
ncbi:MAG: ComEC/Rec2 family competence protein [Chloroflexota bacterium]